MKKIEEVGGKRRGGDGVTGVKNGKGRKEEKKRNFVTPPDDELRGDCGMLPGGEAVVVRQLG
jgi:hypothetical protein